MDMHLQACMGKLVGPAGGAGGGAGGGGISAQFRILPNSLSSDMCSVDAEKVPVAAGQRAAQLQLRVSSPTTPHRTFSPEPLKHGDDYHSSGSSPPFLDATKSGFVLRDAVPPRAKGPAVTYLTPVPALAIEDFQEHKFVFDDGEVAPTESLADENMLQVN